MPFHFAKASYATGKYISQDFYTIADEIHIVNFHLIKWFLLIHQTLVPPNLTACMYAWHTVRINTKMFIVTNKHNHHIRKEFINFQ